MLGRALYQSNRWWGNGKVEQDFLFPSVRNEFADILELINNNRILSLVGPRRVGKATLLYLTIDHLLNAKVDPKRIIFFSCDDQALFVDTTSLEDVLNYYFDSILFESLANLSAQIFVVIDEIHAATNWQLLIKNYVDRRVKVKFIISGSSMTQLLHGSRESLMGRIDDLHILPLDFHQFLNFSQSAKPNEAISRYLDLMPKITFLDDPTEFYHDLDRKRIELEPDRPVITKLLQEYMLVGGYPEYFAGVSLIRWQQRLLQDIVTRGLYKDIVLQYSIKNPEKLEKLMYFIAANQGQPHSFRTIGQTLDIDSNTASSYLSYLSEANLIAVLENYSTNAAKTLRQNKKLFLMDNGICNAFLINRSLSYADEGPLAETCLIQLGQAYAEKNLLKVNYYRDDQGEIDMVLDKRSSVLPIEVKFQRTINQSDLNPLLRFKEKFHCEKMIMITRDELKIWSEVMLIPLWMIR